MIFHSGTASRTAFRAPTSLPWERFQVRGLRAVDPWLDEVRRGRPMPRPVGRGGVQRRWRERKKKMTGEEQEIYMTFNCMQIAEREVEHK